MGASTMTRRQCFKWGERVLDSNEIQEYCKLLTEMNCDGCLFYKTHAEYGSREVERQIEAYAQKKGVMK